MYAFSIQIPDHFEQAVKRVTDALKTEGFDARHPWRAPLRGALKRVQFRSRRNCGVLTDIDVQRTMKEKLNIDGRPYRILGACNPPLAHRALSADPDIGLLLPCNVVVREEADKTVTVAFADRIKARAARHGWRGCGFMDPVAVLKLTDNPDIGELARDVRGRLERVRDALRKR